MLLMSLLTVAGGLWLGLTLALVVLPLFSAMLPSGILTPATMFGAVNSVPMEQQCGRAVELYWHVHGRVFLMARSGHLSANPL